MSLSYVLVRLSIFILVLQTGIHSSALSSHHIQEKPTVKIFANG